MSAQQIADRIHTAICMALGCVFGAIVGDVSKALLTLLAGVALSEAFDLVCRWSRDAWPVIRNWWTR